MKLNLEKLLSYKAILSGALAAGFLVAAILLDLHRGFLREVVSDILYVAGGAIAGALAYYLFLEDMPAETV